MTEPHCLCEQCKMTVLQCKERPAKESSDVLDELEKRVEENGSLYLQASAFFRWIKELRTKER